MGWAKTFEDNQEILQDRLYNWYNVASMIHPSSLNRKPRKACPPKETSGTAQQCTTSKKEKKHYKDKRLVCVICEQTFLFSVSEQKRFAQRCWTQPKRCKACREYCYYKQSRPSLSAVL